MDALSVLLYAEINLTLFVILAILLVKAFSDLNKRPGMRLFVAMVISLMVFTISDVLWSLLEGGYILPLESVLYVVNAVYFISISLVALLWFIFSETTMGSPLVKTYVGKALVAIPFAIVVGLAVTAPLNRLLFYFDAAGSYVRGPLHALQMAFLFAYVVIAAAHALVAALQKKNFARRNELLTLVWFAVPAVAFAALQAVVAGAPWLSSGTTIAALLTFINMRDQLISQDMLTNMNNRKQMLRFLSQRMVSLAPDRHLYLLMLDLDGFKSINDEFGHTEGDRALVLTANAMRKATSDIDCFCSRYGGDEFVLIYETSDADSVDALIEKIRSTMDEAIAAHNAPYKIGFSIGCVEYLDRAQTIPDLIIEADHEMYKQKQLHHGQRA